MATPRIHIGGTQPDELDRSFEAAQDATRDLITALEGTCPHQRDYITAPLAYRDDYAQFAVEMGFLRSLLVRLENTRLWIDETRPKKGGG